MYVKCCLEESREAKAAKTHIISNEHEMQEDEKEAREKNNNKELNEAAASVMTKTNSNKNETSGDTKKNANNKVKREEPE